MTSGGRCQVGTSGLALILTRADLLALILCIDFISRKDSAVKWFENQY